MLILETLTETGCSMPTTIWWVGSELDSNRCSMSNQVQRGPGYVTTLKMFSTRTKNGECLNDQNVSMLTSGITDTKYQSFSLLDSICPMEHSIPTWQVMSMKTYLLPGTGIVRVLIVFAFAFHLHLFLCVNSHSWHDRRLRSNPADLQLRSQRSKCFRRGCLRRSNRRCCHDLYQSNH